MAKRSAARIRRIAITTGGGDAPGLNAVIRAVVMAAARQGWDCVGIRSGYDGLLSDAAGQGLIALTPALVRGITHLGGTILGTTNAGNPLRYPVPLAGGRVAERDRSAEVIRALRRARVDALVAIGGDGSLGIAAALAKRGLRVVGVPKTIDNDLDRTVITFGFDSAVSFATECLDRLHTTAAAHRRILVVEVMGRYAGWIALHSGLSGDAHAILIPEIPYQLSRVASALQARAPGYALVVVAEGARPKGGRRAVIDHPTGAAERLGGAGARVAAELATLTGRETRHVVLGHLLRGGSPTTFDRLLSLRFGAAAVRALASGRSGVMVSLDPPAVKYVPLAQAVRRMRTVPRHSDTVRTARELGISLGD